MGGTKEELRKKKRKSSMLRDHVAQREKRLLTRKGHSPGKLDSRWAMGRGKKRFGIRFLCWRPALKRGKGQREGSHHYLSKPAFFWPLN